jgi:hypothetical protein
VPGVLAEWISAPSPELSLLKSVNGTKRRDFDSSVTKRVIVAF